MKAFIKAHKGRITIVLLVTLIINSMALRVFDAPLKNDDCPNGIVSFELAKNLDSSVDILDSWNAQEKTYAGLSLGIDFLYLFVYSTFIALLIFNINNRLWENRAFYKLGKLLIILIFSAALFDAIENIALIKLLLGDLRQIWASVAYYFAAMKFAIVLVCIVYLLANWSVLLIRVLRPKKASLE